MHGNESGNGHADGLQPRSGAFLTIILTVLFGGGFVLFLIYVTFGFFFWVIVGAAALGVFGLFHYLVWGRSFDQSVQGERELLEQEEQSPEQHQQKTPWERRF